jgi:iron(III) transport system permease protein
MAAVIPKESYSKPRRRRSQSLTGAGFCTLVLGVMALFTLYPLVMLIYGSVLVEQPDGTKALGLSAWLYAWQQPGMVTAITNTVERVVVTEIISVPIAILVAWLVARTDLPGKKIIDTFIWVAFFLPTVPVLMGWILLFDPDFGLVNKFLRALFGADQAPVLNIYSFWGIIFAHLASRSIAAKYIFLAPAFRNFDSSLEEASRVVGSSPLATIWRIVLPILKPAILVMFVLSLFHSLESFETELILGPPIGFYVFSTKIYQLVHDDPPLFGAATVLGLAILIALLPLIVWQQRLISTRSYVTVTSHFKTQEFRLRGWRWPIFGLMFVLGLAVTVIPTVFLVMGTFMNIFGYFNLDTVWTTWHWDSVLSDSVLMDSIINTIILAGGAALIGVIWYALMAYISSRTRYVGRGAVDFMTWLPATLPGIILSLGLLWMFLSVPFFRPLYGTMAILIIAVLINSVTTGVQLIKSNMVQVGNELEEASFMLGGSWLYTFRRIMLPILGPALLSVALLTFNSAARNVANIAMIVTSDNRPLSILQIDYVADGQLEKAAIVGTMVVVLTFGAAVLARLVAHRFGFRTA